MTVVSRREFMGACAGTVLAAGVETSAQPPPYVYVCESHYGGDKGRLVIGLLMTPALAPHLDAIAAIKKRTRYRRSVRGGSNDAFMVGCAREMARYFATSKDLRFAARVVPARYKDLESDSFRISQLLDAFADAKVAAGATVRMKQRKTRWYTASGSEAGLREHNTRTDALRSKRAIARVEPIVRRKHDGLLELSSLLTGLLFNTAHRGEPRYANGITQGPAIRLRDALGVKSLLMSVPGRWDVVVKT